VTDSLQGRLYFWGARALYLGRGLAATVHAHHAIQICVPLTGSVRLRPGPGTRWKEYEAAVIPGNQPHESDVAVELIASLWIEPETARARRLLPRQATRGIVPLPPAFCRSFGAPLLACWDDGWSSRRAAALVEDIVREVAADQSPAAGDPRVMRALEILGSAPERRVRLADVAAGVSLSPSRLAHLLRAEIGLPARRYLLWLRLRDAVQALARGMSVTDAAHAAGFADAPHFDRTFRRMLGFTPCAAPWVSTFVQAVPAAKS
jgi:AraC family transcriptional regulator